MSEVKRCEACGYGIMKFDKKMGTKKTYKARRWVCDECGHSETYFGDSSGDRMTEHNAVKAAENLARTDVIITKRISKN